MNQDLRFGKLTPFLKTAHSIRSGMQLIDDTIEKGKANADVSKSCVWRQRHTDARATKVLISDLSIPRYVSQKRSV